MTKSPIRTEFEKRAKAIKRFVSFNVQDQTIKPKSLADKVRRYYHLIYGKAGQPGLYNPATDVPMRPRGKAFAAVRDSEGQPAHRGIKVVFVETVENPTQPGTLLTPRIRMEGGKVLKSNFDVTQTFYPFRAKVRAEEGDDDAMADAFGAEVERILAKAPNVKSWVVKCGKRQTANPKSRRGIVEYVKNLLYRYADTAHDWLAGLVAYEFENTASLQSFLADRDKIRKGKSGRKTRRRNRR